MKFAQDCSIQVYIWMERKEEDAFLPRFPPPSFRVYHSYIIGKSISRGAIYFLLLLLLCFFSVSCIVFFFFFLGGEFYMDSIKIRSE